MTTIKLIGGGIVLSALAIGGQNMYMNRQWRESHPLITEAIELSQKDQRIRELIGPTLIKIDSCQGVLDNSRNWSNLNFEIQGGKGKAKLVFLAESSQDPSYPIEAPAKPQTILEMLMCALNQMEEPVAVRWKIINMHVKISESTSIRVIGEKVKSHEELRSVEIVTESNEIQHPSIEQTIIDRRNENYKKARGRWVYLACAGLLVLATWWCTRKYFTFIPVGKSLLLNNAMERIRTDNFVRKHIGHPVNHFGNLKGYLNTSMDKGKFEALIYGPIGIAKLNASGKYDSKNKIWKYDELKITKDGESHSVI